MLPSFRLIVATFCCGFIMVFAGLRLATSINGLNQAMPVMAAHAAPAMVSAISDQDLRHQDLRRSPATVPVMYDMRFAVSATQLTPMPVAATPAIDRATPLMMPLVILPPIAQEAAGPYTPERAEAPNAEPQKAEAQVVAALPARAAAEPAPVTIDIPLPEPVAVDLTFSPRALPQEIPAAATTAPQAMLQQATPPSAPVIEIPLPEPEIVDLTLPPPVKRETEADGRGGASHDKRSDTDARSDQSLTVATLDIPAGTVVLPTKAIPLPRPKVAQHAAVVHAATPKPRRKTARASQSNDFENLFGAPSGRQQ